MPQGQTVSQSRLPIAPIAGRTTASTGKLSRMSTLADVVALARTDSFLAMVSTVRSDAMIQTSLVNAGVMAHPLSGEEVVAFVTYGRGKLSNLRARPQINVSWRAGWQWIAVEGTAEIIGVDDPHPDVDAERLRVLLREIFISAGGTHDDWDEYDRVMAREGREAVFVTPTRIYTNASR
jgi:PPOX class probable F420-dependent enzyme